MTWSAVQGQALATRLLLRACQTGQVAHAYVFHGPEGIGKRLAAMEMAKALLCKNGGSDGCTLCARIDQSSHPDVLTVAPDGRTIKIDQIRELQGQLYRRPAESSRRIAIIDGAERMSVEAANSMLKLLEEPPGYVCLILLCTSLAAMLPTIISRAQVVGFQPLAPEVIAMELVRHGCSTDQALLAASLANGSLSRALELVDDTALREHRGDLLTLLQQARGLSDFELLGWSERLEKQKDSLELHLELLASLLRDALIMAVDGDPALITNVDLIPDLQEIATTYGAGSLRSMVQQTLTAAGYLRRNANVRLTMDWLCLHLGTAS